MSNPAETALDAAATPVPVVGSLADLYERDYRRVVALVYGISGSRSAAEEIAQDAFVIAHRHWHRVAPLDDPGGWVRVVALNRARSLWRRRMAEARALARLGSRRATPAELSTPTADFWAAVRALPRQQSLVVALFYGEDRSVADIAALLDISDGAVKTHLSRARDALRSSLASQLDDGLDEGGDDGSR